MKSRQPASEECGGQVKKFGDRISPSVSPTLTIAQAVCTTVATETHRKKTAFKRLQRSVSEDTNDRQHASSNQARPQQVGLGINRLPISVRELLAGEPLRQDAEGRLWCRMQDGEF